MSVLLPQPDGPIITVSLPRSMVKEQSCTTSLAEFGRAVGLADVRDRDLSPAGSGTGRRCEVDATGCGICCMFIDLFPQRSFSQGVTNSPSLRSSALEI